jgi:hypothetical protein
MAEVKFNMQSGFWVGCAGGFFFGCVAVPFLLLIFKVPEIPPSGDRKPNAVARAKQAGIYNGLGASMLMVAIIWIIATIGTGLTVYTYYTYDYNYYNGSYSTSPRYYSSNGPWYVFIGPAIAWLLASIIFFLCGRAKKQSLMNQLAIQG